MARVREEKDRDGFFRRAVDYIFGYDFFISYSHGDGKTYPQQLKTRLDQAGFKVFLDQTEYVAGLDLRRETKRHVEKSRQVVVVGRPAALESKWVKREVDVALAGRKTPVIINVNRAIENAPAAAPVASLALESHWLRLDETLEDPDGAPSDGTVNELIRGFRHTRQQTKRLRIFAAASLVLALVAGTAVWQAIEAVIARDRARTSETIALENANEAKRQKGVAETNEKQAKSERDRALTAQSRFLGGLADQYRSSGDAMSAILLALEGLPETAGQRPHVPQTEKALLAATAAPRELQVLAGHGGAVLAVSISPDGKRIATASEDETARLWNAETGALLAVLRGHTDPVKKALFSRDGERLLTFAAHASRSPSDGTARLWDGRTGQEVAALAHGGTVLTAQFSPDDERILTAGTDGVRLWEVRSGRLVAKLAVKSWIYHVWFSVDGRRLLMALDSDRSQIWNGRTGEPLFELRGTPLAFMPDGSAALTTVADQTLLWDATTGKEIGGFAAEERKASAACFSPDGTRLGLGFQNGNASLWSVSERRILANMNAHKDAILACEFGSNGERLLTTSTDGTVRLWNGQTGALVQLLSHRTFSGRGWQQFPGAIFDAAGRSVLTTGNDSTARLWNADSGAPIAVLAGHRGELNAVAFGLDGPRVVTASRDHTARVWDTSGGEHMALQDAKLDVQADGTLLITSFDSAALAPWRAVMGLQVSVLHGPKERILGSSGVKGLERAVTTRDSTVWLWNGLTGKQAAELAGHKHGATGAAFSKNGNRLVTFYVAAGLNADGKWPEPDPPRLWDVASNRLVATLNGHDREVIAIAFSPDDSWLVTTSKDGTAWIWDARTGQPVTRLTGHDNQVEGAVFSKQGGRLITYSRDGTARLWSTADWQSVAVLRHDNEVTGVAFSPDGALALTASLDHTARLWDAGTGAQKAVLPHDDYVHAAVFSQLGTRIITTSRDTKGRVWEAATGNLIATLEGHGHTVWTAGLTADGARAVTGSDDGTARLWNAETGAQVGQLEHGRGVLRLAATPDGQHVVTVAEGDFLRLWQTFSDTGALIAATKRRAPRCLTPLQRRANFLEADPPSWCIDMSKWPYTDPAWRQWAANKRSGAPPEIREDFSVPLGRSGRAVVPIGEHGQQ